MVCNQLDSCVKLQTEQKQVIQKCLKNILFHITAIFVNFKRQKTHPFHGGTYFQVHK